MNENPSSSQVSKGSTEHFSARRPKHSVVFFLCKAPQAKRVSLVGDFNDWKASANPMERTPDGCWNVRLEVPHGSYRYLFLVDGQPMLDPKGEGIVQEANPWHEAASLKLVS